MSLPDHLDFGPEMRPRRRSPDALYYGSDCFANDPEKWLKRKRRQIARRQGTRAQNRLRDDTAARKRRGWSA
jgi:hypothetical protein